MRCTCTLKKFNLRHVLAHYIIHFEWQFKLPVSDVKDFPNIIVFMSESDRCVMTKGRNKLRTAHKNAAVV